MWYYFIYVLLNCYSCLLLTRILVLLLLFLYLDHLFIRMSGARVAQWVRSLDLTTHTRLSPIRRWFAPGFVNYKKGCILLAAASDKVYQLLAHSRWFSPGTPASSTTKTGRHDRQCSWNIVESGVKTPKIKSYQIKSLECPVWLWDCIHLWLDDLIHWEKENITIPWFPSVWYTI